MDWNTMSNEEKKEQIETSFFEILDVLRLHKNKKWEDRKEFIFEDKFTVKPIYYDGTKTEVSVSLPDGTIMSVHLLNNEYIWEGTGLLDVSIYNPLFSDIEYFNSDCQVTVDLKNFKLQSREIGKVRKLLEKVVLVEQIIISQIEFLEERINGMEKTLPEFKESLSKKKKFYSDNFGMKEVA